MPNRNGQAAPLPTAQRYAHIVGWGMAVPEKVLTNDDLTAIVETSDEWIQARTGIKERRIAGEKETTATLALKAAQRALEIAELTDGAYDPALGHAVEALGFGPSGVAGATALAPRAFSPLAPPAAANLVRSASMSTLVPGTCPSSSCMAIVHRQSSVPSHGADSVG